MGAVRGLLLDESILLAEDESGNPCLPPGPAILLRRLQYSNLSVGLCHRGDVSSQKAVFLARAAASYSFDCISLHASHISELLPAWSAGQSCFLVTSVKDDELFCELQSHGWRIICISAVSGTGMNKELLFVDKLEKLLMTICSFSKMAMSNTSVVIIGYVMKPSREEDFAKRGAFPLYPTQNGLMFVPLSLELPLAPQIQKVDVVLHKATDEIISIDPCFFLDFPKGISFSGGMHELERYFQDRRDCCLIDPLNNIYPLLDRLKIQQILLGLQSGNIKGCHRLRAPQFLKVDNFREPSLREQLLEAKLSFPVIVKPEVACGVVDAHNMALVFKFEDFNDLCVPLPAIVQEYVDHGSLLFKFYVLGDKVFHATKKSMPNSNNLFSSSKKTGFAPIIFNSLKSLPIDYEGHPSLDDLKGDGQSLDVELINNAAKWLRKELSLTIFGFDVVVQQGSGHHVIVDLNYLPSFKEIPDKDAIPAFWDAIKSSYELWRAN